MSDRDLELFKASLPRLINTPEGNRTIIATMRVMAEYDAEGARIVQQVRDKELTNAQAFDALFAREHPAMWVREGDSEEASAATPAVTPSVTPAGTPAANAPIEEVYNFYLGSGVGGGQ